MMAFQIDQLAALLACVEEGTFDAAAKRLRVTASAVSQRIKSMEQEAGRVLVRRSNPIAVTAAGEVVLRYARQVQLLESETSRELGVGGELARDDGGGASGTPPVVVSLAINADSLATWFLDALARLPGRDRVSFDLHREDQEHTTALLRSGAVLAAVTSTAVAVQGCSVEPLGIMRYRAVCTPTFADRWRPPGAQATAAGWIAESPVVTFDRRDDLQLQFAREALGRLLGGPCHYVPTSADFARAVTLGFGWGLLPEQQCSAGLADGSLIELGPGHPVDVPLFWQRWNLASPLLDALSSAVRAGARSALRPFPSVSTRGGPTAPTL